MRLSAHHFSVKHSCVSQHNAHQFGRAALFSFIYVHQGYNIKSARLEPPRLERFPCLLHDILSAVFEKEMR
jgi:hypothetical protein